MAGNEIQCSLTGAEYRDGRCWLGDAPIVEENEDLSAEIAAAQGEDRYALVVFTSEWCPGCRLMKQDFIEGSKHIPSNMKMIVCDATRGDCAVRGPDWLPSMRLFSSPDDPGDTASFSLFLNSYSAGHQLGLETLYVKRGAAQIGPVFNPKTPLAAYGAFLQIGANVTFARSFEEASLGLKLFSPTIGDLVDMSPVRFLGLYAGMEGVLDKGANPGLRIPIGVEIFHGTFDGWSFSITTSAIEYAPIGSGKTFDWLPRGGLNIAYRL